MEKTRISLNIILLSFIVSFGGFIFGYDTGVISGITQMSEFARTYGRDGAASTGLPSWLRSLIVGLPSLGMFMGSIGSGLLGDHSGRKKAILYASVIFVIGVTVQITSTYVSVFVIGRTISGMAIGLLSGLVTLYHAECAPKALRGSMVATYQLAITAGILVSYVINYLTKDMPSKASYTIPMSMQFISVSIIFFGMFFIPETPRFLLSRNDEQRAADSLMRIHGEKVITREIQDSIQEISTEIEKERNLPVPTYSSFFKGITLRRLLIAVGSQVFQQLTGINFIFYFGISFFKDAGLSDPYLGGIIAGVVNVVSTLPGMYLVDRLGRRYILMAGALIMALSQLAIGIIGSADTKEQMDLSSGISVLVFSCIFVAGFAFSWGICAWIVSTEVFNQMQRSRGNSLAVSSNWITNSLIALTTPMLVDRDSLGMGARIGYLWFIFNSLAFVFVYLRVPETKGLSLEEINVIFDHNISARETKKMDISAYRTTAGREEGIISNTSAEQTSK